MNLYTLSEIRTLLWRYSPIPKTPIATATNAQKELFNNYLNQVCERLLGRFKPRFSMYRVNVPIYNYMITIPRELDGIDGIELVNENNCPCVPLQIYSRFHEWATRAANCCCSSAVFVLSDTVQVFQDPSPGNDGFQLKVVSTEPDTPDMLFKGGYDADWNQIFATETLAIGNGSFTTTTIWKSMPQIQKPVTDNLVELYSVDVETAEETLIAVYAPGERIPAYKRYRLPECRTAVFARVFGKLAYNEVTADNDIPVPQALGALKAGLQALAYEDAADMQRSDLLWNRAYAILNEERAEAEDAEEPILKVSSTFGCGNVLNVM